MIDNRLIMYDMKIIIIYMLDFYRNIYGDKGIEYLKQYIDYYANEKPIQYEKIALERYLIYKLTAESTVKFIKNADCDSLEVVVRDYKKIYPWLKSFKVREQQFENRYELYNAYDYVLRGDTMTSIQTTLKKYLYLKLGIKEFPKNISFERYIFNNLQYLDLSFSCGLFIESMHCFGNFIPVPQGFNVGRSYFGITDYWDLTMECLYKWYLDNSSGNHNDKALELLFKHANVKYKQAIINNTKIWLNMFHDWNDFLKQNYLYCYVDENTLEPLYLFDGHSFEHPVPETIEEIEELFIRASNFAHNRMIEMGVEEIDNQ